MIRRAQSRTLHPSPASPRCGVGLQTCACLRLLLLLGIDFQSPISRLHQGEMTQFLAMTEERQMGQVLAVAAHS